VLQLAPRVCWPLDTGAKLRNYHLARVVSKHASVTLLAFTDPHEQLVDFEGPYEQVITVTRDRGYTPAKILRGALGRTPISLLNYTTQAMKQALARILSDDHFDVVQIESVHLMRYLPIIRSARDRPLVVCDWHNIESEVMRRYSEREPNFVRRKYAKRAARQLRVLEQQATHDFDVHVVVSDRDRDQLLQLNPRSFISVIENGVDSRYYSDQEIEKAHTAWRIQRAGGVEALTQPPAKVHRIVFVGSMDYHANIDAAIDFARDVWPAIYERNPQLIFTIVGRDPAVEVRQLASNRGIDVTGTVDDVRPYYHEAIASIVPLKVGGGSRLKILESMAAGVPVVSTTLGAEGLEVGNGTDIVIADTNEQLVNAITRVLADEKLRVQLVSAGRDLVSRRYEWEIAGQSLFSIYEEFLSLQANKNQ
jgi:glycosyltransferase involved in cell wall biosynthesis